MDAATLCDAMPGLELSRAQTEIEYANAALSAAHCDTVDRSAMFLAQVGHESMSLRYTEEIASGAAYEGRHDLGNAQSGDGRRFKGRSYIQVTGRHNYTHLSRWAHKIDIVPSATYFVDHPEQLADDQYRWLGPVWYWETQRPMNDYADRGDIYGGTRAVNGGLNGVSDRINRWRICRRLGRSILPTANDQDCAVQAAVEEDEMALSRYYHWRDETQHLARSNDWQAMKVDEDSDDGNEMDVIDGPTTVIAGTVHLVISGLKIDNSVWVRPYAVVTYNGPNKRGSVGDQVKLDGSHDGWVRASFPYDWNLGSAPEDAKGRFLRFEWMSDTTDAKLQAVRVSGTELPR